MRAPCAGGPQIVRVVGKNETPLFQRERDVCLIARSQQAGVARRRNVDASQAEPLGNIVIDLFVKMKSNHDSLPCL